MTPAVAFIETEKASNDLIAEATKIFYEKFFIDEKKNNHFKNFLE